MLGKNGDRVSILHAFFAISIPLLYVTSLFFLASLLYKSYVKGALVTNVLVILFYGTRLLIDFIFVPLSMSIYLFRVRYVLIMLFLATLFFLYKMFKTRFAATFVLKVAFIPFLILNLFGLTSFTYKKVKFEQAKKIVLQENEPFKNNLTKLAQKTTQKNPIYPDIYFIIFDCYLSDKALKKGFNLDNRPFTSELKKQGFQIATESESNFPCTGPSLYTTLNMNYLSNRTFFFPYGCMLQNNNAKHFVKKMGYKYIDLSLDYDDLAVLQEETDYFKIKKERNTLWGELKLFLLGQLYFTNSFVTKITPLYPFYEKLAESIRRKSIMKKFRVLENLPSYQKKPKFVYAHFLIPHVPQSFDENGNPYPRQTKDESFIEWQNRGYVHAVKFINKKIVHLVDQLLKNSAKSPVIIIQGDHGINFPKSTMKDWYKILSAFYLPKGSAKLPLDICPINNFRFVFNHYFKTSLPILEKKQFMGPLIEGKFFGMDMRQYTDEPLEGKTFAKLRKFTA